MSLFNNGPVKKPDLINPEVVSPTNRSLVPPSVPSIKVDPLASNTATTGYHPSRSSIREEGHDIFTGGYPRGNKEPLPSLAKCREELIKNCG